MSVLFIDFFSRYFHWNEYFIAQNNTHSAAIGNKSNNSICVFWKLRKMRNWFFLSLLLLFFRKEKSASVVDFLDEMQNIRKRISSNACLVWTSMHVITIASYTYVSCNQMRKSQFNFCLSIKYLEKAKFIRLRRKLFWLIHDAHERRIETLRCLASWIIPDKTHAK